jgi:sodium transport system permease protein
VSKFARAGVVFAKEILEHSRDRRALFSVLSSSLIGPLLIGFLFFQIAKDRRAADDIEIPVAGREHAPHLMKWLGEQPGVTIVDGPEKPEEAVQAGDFDFALVVEDDFGKRFEQSRPATVKIYYDDARTRARPKVDRIRRLISGYSQQISDLRLVARGISPLVSQPIRLQSLELSSAQRRASRVLSFVPLMLLIAAFAAGISPSVDSTAGERERGSLEPLLINPVSTLAVATGKWMAAAVFAAAALSVSLVLVLVLLVKLPLGDLGVYFRIEPWQIGGLLAAALPVALLAPAFQMLVACYARSFKEAQTYLGYVMMIPMIPTIVMMGMGVERSPWMNLVPIVAQTQLIQSFLAAEMPAAWELVVSGGMALALSMLCVYGVAQLLRREKIVFGR